jgi:adenosylcobinamide kinase/adenosylcobinamide-phosphate guanylyltransferase
MAKAKLRAIKRDDSVDPVEQTIASLLVLGGARSGKSGFAQSQAEASGLEAVFIATAQAYDREMHERIARHADARDERWAVIEAPFDLADAIMRAARADRILLVDCMTLWLTNVMLRGDDVEAATRAVASAVDTVRTPVILVSNEVGSGIVPDNALGRRFRDAQGRLNQALAGVCEAVVLVTAGLPTRLKPTPALGFCF